MNSSLSEFLQWTAKKKKMKIILSLRTIIWWKKNMYNGGHIKVRTPKRQVFWRYLSIPRRYGRVEFTSSWVDELMSWCVDVLMRMCWCIDVLMCWWVGELMCWWGCVDVLDYVLMMCWCVIDQTRRFMSFPNFLKSFFVHIFSIIHERLSVCVCLCICVCMFLRIWISPWSCVFCSSPMWLFFLRTCVHPLQCCFFYLLGD